MILPTQFSKPNTDDPDRYRPKGRYRSFAPLSEASDDAANVAVAMKVRRVVIYGYLVHDWLALFQDDSRQSL